MTISKPFPWADFCRAQLYTLFLGYDTQALQSELFPHLELSTIRDGLKMAPPFATMLNPRDPRPYRPLRESAARILAAYLRSYPGEFPLLWIARFWDVSIHLLGRFMQREEICTKPWDDSLERLRQAVGKATCVVIPKAEFSAPQMVHIRWLHRFLGLTVEEVARFGAVPGADAEAIKRHLELPLPWEPQTERSQDMVMRLGFHAMSPAQWRVLADYTSLYRHQAFVKELAKLWRISPKAMGRAICDLGFEDWITKSHRERAGVELRAAQAKILTLTGSKFDQVDLCHAKLLAVVGYKTGQIARMLGRSATPKEAKALLAAKLPFDPDKRRQGGHPDIATFCVLVQYVDRYWGIVPLTYVCRLFDVTTTATYKLLAKLQGERAPWNYSRAEHAPRLAEVDSRTLDAIHVQILLTQDGMSQERLMTDVKFLPAKVRGMVPELAQQRIAFRHALVPSPKQPRTRRLPHATRVILLAYLKRWRKRVPLTQTARFFGVSRNTVKHAAKSLL